MLRAVVIAGSVIALICAAVFGKGLLEIASTGAETPQQRECNLLDNHCEWSGANGNWRVEMSVSTDAEQSHEYLLKVTADDAPERFLAVLRGSTMYMGEYPVQLVEAGNNSGVYTAHFNSPVCSTGDSMIWRVDLQQGQTVIENVPIKMVFQASH